VLVALADGDDGTAGVLLTRRSLLLRNHSGEISFPGGRIDVGETASDAARREAEEEVGLAPFAAPQFSPGAATTAGPETTLLPMPSFPGARR
jgi:8-oxo-dGTP pyrophosphatase MutT (NUDIX family)